MAANFLGKVLSKSMHGAMDFVEDRRQKIRLLVLSCRLGGRSARILRRSLRMSEVGFIMNQHEGLPSSCLDLADVIVDFGHKPAGSAHMIVGFVREIAGSAHRIADFARKAAGSARMVPERDFATHGTCLAAC